MLKCSAQRTPDIAVLSRRHLLSTPPCHTSAQQPATPCCRHDVSGAAAPLWPSQALCRRLRSGGSGRMGHGGSRCERLQRLCLSAAAVADSALVLPGAQLDRVRALWPPASVALRDYRAATMHTNASIADHTSWSRRAGLSCWPMRYRSSAKPLPSCCAVNGGVQIRRVISLLRRAHAGSRGDRVQLPGSCASRCAVRHGQGAHIFRPLLLSTSFSPARCSMLTCGVSGGAAGHPQ